MQATTCALLLTGASIHCALTQKLTGTDICIMQYTACAIELTGARTGANICALLLTGARIHYALTHKPTGMDMHYAVNRTCN